VKKRSPNVVPRKRPKRNVSNWKRNFVEKKKNVSPGKSASRRSWPGLIKSLISVVQTKLLPERF
jgi:hypothetical protein